MVIKEIPGAEVTCVKSSEAGEKCYKQIHIPPSWDIRGREGKHRQISKALLLDPTSVKCSSSLPVS